MPALQRTGKEITEIYNRQVDTAQKGGLFYWIFHYPCAIIPRLLF